MTDLGFVPSRANLILSLGADWVCSLTSKGEVWPADTECWVEVDGLEDPWEAVVNETTATASFVVQSATTDPVDDGTNFRLYLRFPGTPSTEYLWFYGQVRRVEE